MNFKLLFPFYPTCHKENFNDEFFCDAWRHPDWRKFCCRAATPTSLPGALSWYGHKQLPIRLMGPPCSLQPSIDKLTWHPPVEFWGVACQLVFLPPMLKWQLEEQTQWPGLQDLRHQVLWTPEGVYGKWENEGLGRAVMQAVGRGKGRNMRWFPSAIHRDLLPQTPLWPPWAFLTPLFLVAAPLLPVSVPPPSSH